MEIGHKCVRLTEMKDLDRDRDEGLRERQRWRTWTETDGGRRYWPHFKPLSVLLLLLHWVAPRVTSLTWLPFWLPTDSSVSGYLFKCNFIMPMYTGYYYCSQPTWPSSAVLLFKQLEHPVLEIPNWRVCQRSICNTPPYPILLNVHLWNISQRPPLSLSLYPHLTKKLHKDNNSKNKTILTYLKRWPFHYVTIAPSTYYLNYFYTISSHSWLSHMHASKYNTITYLI